MPALEKDVRFIRWVGAEIRNTNEEIMEWVVQQKGLLLRFADPDSEIRKNPRVALAAVQQNGRALRYVDSSLKSEEHNLGREIVLAAIEENPHALHHAGAFQGNREIVLDAVQRNGLTLQYAEKFQEDLEVVLAAVRQNRFAISYTTEELKFCPKIVVAAAKQNSCEIATRVIRSAPRELLSRKFQRMERTASIATLTGIENQGKRIEI